MNNPFFAIQQAFALLRFSGFCFFFVLCSGPVGLQCQTYSFMKTHVKFSVAPECLFSFREKEVISLRRSSHDGLRAFADECPNLLWEPPPVLVLWRAKLWIAQEKLHHLAKSLGPRNSQSSYPADVRKWSFSSLLSAKGVVKFGVKFWWNFPCYVFQGLGVRGKFHQISRQKRCEKRKIHANFTLLGAALRNSLVNLVRPRLLN